MISTGRATAFALITAGVVLLNRRSAAWHLIMLGALLAVVAAYNEGRGGTGGIGPYPSFPPGPVDAPRAMRQVRERILSGWN